MMKKQLSIFLALILLAALMTGCAKAKPEDKTSEPVTETVSETEPDEKPAESEDRQQPEAESKPASEKPAASEAKQPSKKPEQKPEKPKEPAPAPGADHKPDSKPDQKPDPKPDHKPDSKPDPKPDTKPDSALKIPAYAGKPYVILNEGEPFFTAEEINDHTPRVHFSELDSLGRCGPATACVSVYTLAPEGSRQKSLSNITPTGWIEKKYDNVTYGYLYHRLPLIPYADTNVQPDPRCVITSTAYMQYNGMLPIRNHIGDYLRSECAQYPVLVRVTPVFTGNNLLADGILVEALSLGDNGTDITICAFCYNVQPGVILDYATGESRQA